MTLMPVMRTSTLVLCSMKVGAARWIERVSVVVSGPCSSTGSPMTFMMRPSTPLPTGIWIGLPVSRTSMPRTRPSVVSMAIARTVRSPRCSATSRVRLSGWSLMRVLLSLSAVKISGRLPVNSTSTTGPMTWVILPTPGAPGTVTSASAARCGAELGRPPSSELGEPKRELGLLVGGGGRVVMGRWWLRSYGGSERGRSRKIGWRTSP